MMVPTYPAEDDSRALKVYQHRSTIWLCGSGTRRLSSELKEQLSLERCVGRFGWNLQLHGKTARSAL
jgi:hypothetical protein